MKDLSMLPRLTTLFFLCLSLTALAFSGRVVAVADGDTCTVLTADKQQLKIRLNGIDAPEKRQPFGNQAKKALSEKIFGATIEVKVKTKDRYGRAVADLYLGKRWINRELVAEGWAWHYRQYSSDQDLAAAEEKARKESKGLWAGDKPTAPWQYRHSPGKLQPGDTGYWLNTSSNTRHNSGCKYYRKTSKGRPATATEGKPCGLCNG